jgi:hypothetical protein
MLFEPRAGIVLTQSLEGCPVLGELLRDTTLGRDNTSTVVNSMQGTACRQLCVGFQQCRSFVEMCTVSCVLAQAHKGG